MDNETNLIWEAFNGRSNEISLADEIYSILEDIFVTNADSPGDAYIDAGNDIQQMLKKAMIYSDTQTVIDMYNENIKIAVEWFNQSGLPGSPIDRGSVLEQVFDDIYKVNNENEESDGIATGAFTDFFDKYCDENEAGQFVPKSGVVISIEGFDIVNIISLSENKDTVTIEGLSDSKYSYLETAVDDFITHATIISN